MIVYLDLDGVLVDFVGGVNKVFGLPDVFPPPKNGIPQWNWFREYGITDEEVNECCTSDFWLNLNWTSDGHDILRTVTTHFKPKDIYLLTVPMPNLQSAWGKAEWVNKHLPEYNKRLIITRAPKNLLAGPNALLIDDNDDNVNGFRENGGCAILVPRPWNSLHYRSNCPLGTIQYDLDELMGGEDVQSSCGG